MKRSEFTERARIAFPGNGRKLSVMIRETLDFLLDFIFPRRCVSCRREGSMLCDACRAALPTVSAACFVCERRSPTGEICESCKPKTRLRRFVAPLRYGEPAVSELIHALKYAGMRDLAPVVAEYVASYIKEAGVSIPAEAVFAPIPLHPKRLRERGFNQAQLIAEYLGTALAIPVRAGMLVRLRHTVPQTSLKTREAREKNAQGLYAVARPIEKGETIILIDDVSTTGATLEAAAKVLKEAGAKQVWALAAARS